MALYQGLFDPQSLDVTHLQAHPDFEGSRGLDINDSDGSHQFILIDSFCGIGKIQITAIALNRCVFNSDPGAPIKLKTAYTY